MTHHLPTDLIPLGFFAVMSYTAEPDRATEVLRALQGQLDEDPRTVAAYLRSGEVILALMEQTMDLIGTSFTTAGGSGIVTDGTYFWRGDTADYVEHHRVGLPFEFLLHAAERDWQVPPLTAAQVRDADVWLEDFYRASFDAALWPDPHDPLTDVETIHSGSSS